MTMQTDGSPILSAKGVTKRFGGLIAVRDIDFDIPQGAIISLIGPNGAGKTTFFNVIAGLMDPTSGHVTFRGRRMIARPIRAWLEPVLWVLPALLIVVIAAGEFFVSRDQTHLALIIAVALA